MTDEPADRVPRDAFTLAAAQLARVFDAARWDVRLYSQDLDGRVYAAEPVVAAARGFLLRGPSSHLTVLVRDESRLRLEGNRLVDLLQRLPSRAGLRVPRPEDSDLNEDLVVVDGLVYYYPLRRDPPAGPVESRRDAAVLGKRLADAWELAEPSVEFRQLTV